MKWQRPFQPFRVFTMQGEVFDISHPGLIIVASNGINIGVPDGDLPPPRVKEVVWLGADEIIRVEPMATVP